MRHTFAYWLAAASFVLPSIGCSGSTSSSSPATDSGVGDSAPVAEAEPITGSCTLSCAGVAQCVTSSSQCASGYCLADSTDSYCTRPCENAPCPEGYECRPVEGIGTGDMRACVAKPAVCGNRVKERGEVCDDGNTVGKDGCSADCKTLEEAPPPDETLAFQFTITSSNSSILASGTITRNDKVAVPTSSITCGTTSAEVQVGVRGSFSNNATNGVFESISIPFCDGESVARAAVVLGYLPGDYVGNAVYGSSYQPVVSVTAVARTSGGVDCKVSFSRFQSSQTRVHIDAPMATSIGGRFEADLGVSSVSAHDVLASPADEQACSDFAATLSGATVKVNGTFTRSGANWKL